MTQIRQMQFHPIYEYEIHLYNVHSFMKHGFFSLKQFLSHITKFPRGFWSSGIFPFTGIYRARFFHSPRFFLSSRGFFHSLWFKSLINIQNSKIFKEMVRKFSLLVKKKLSNIHVNVHPVGLFHSPGFFHSSFKSVFFMKDALVHHWFP